LPFSGCPSDTLSLTLILIFFFFFETILSGDGARLKTREIVIGFLGSWDYYPATLIDPFLFLKNTRTAHEFAWGTSYLKNVD
jgi:hypothetical protein